ncbi:hypothetical protein [Kineococcus sp. SYSU DK005]|uniref:hypothetical protein n=1 Tax=Kineococcus sp. SYSU DK005 TaxID=3383126 RepID=UPI003D7CBA6C
MNPVRGRWLVAFDVDCGEFLPGRRLVLRGLRDEGTWAEAFGDRLPAGVAGPGRAVSLEHEVVPGIREDDPDGPGWYGRELAGVEFHPDLPRPAWDRGDGQGWLAVPPGEPCARGGWGPYALPRGARLLRFAVFANLAVRPAADGGVVVHRVSDPAGHLVVDLATGTAGWEPARPGR